MDVDHILASLGEQGKPGHLPLLVRILIFKFGVIIWYFGVESTQNNHLIFITRPSAAMQVAIVLTNLRKVSLNQVKVSILPCVKKRSSKYQHVSPVRCDRTSRGSPPVRLSRGWSKNQGGCNRFDFWRSLRTRNIYRKSLLQMRFYSEIDVFRRRPFSYLLSWVPVHWVLLLSYLSTWKNHYVMFLEHFMN